MTTDREWYEGLPGSNIAMIADDTPWQCRRAPRIGATFPSPVATQHADRLPDTTDPLAKQHRQTAVFVSTNRGITRPYLGDDDSAYETALEPHIPMGYTSLTVVEKRAVVADGRLVRVWPQRRGRGSVTLYLPPDADQPMLTLSTGSTVLWHGIQTAVNLSARMRGLPILVGVALRSRSWH